MSFNYDKLKSKKDEQNFWASYSDLYTMVSFVFLLLYVVASLRTNTYGVQKNQELKRVTEINEDLKQQLKVYNTLKENYLEKDASEDEMKVYQQLMGKLDLLKEDAKTEKDKLREQAQENEQKEQALNQYQQVVRNIINSNMMSKTAMQRKVEQLSKAKQENASLNSKFKDVEENLNQAKTELSSTQQKLTHENHEKEKLVSQLVETKSNFQSKLAEVESEYKEKQYAERQAYEKKMAHQKMSSKNKDKAMQEFLAKQKMDLKKQLAEQQGQYEKQLAGLSSNLKSNKDELSKAKARLNARKEIANKIKSNFKKAGINALVDDKTGDVTLLFDEYFDTGKADLKEKMKQVLNDSVPVYAQSLFEDKKVADKLLFVEIVGFASPTFDGKYIDPQSLEEKDRKAINYNLDLSYYRARNIFKYIFDQKNVSYMNQQKLQTLVKVTGRSFLAEKMSDSDRGIASGMDQKEFCKKYVCTKAQRVIIKFDIAD